MLGQADRCTDKIISVYPSPFPPKTTTTNKLIMVIKIQIQHQGKIYTEQKAGMDALTLLFSCICLSSATSCSDPAMDWSCSLLACCMLSNCKQKSFVALCGTPTPCTQLWWWWWWFLLHSAILHSRADSLRLHVILHEWLTFYSAFLNIHWSGVLTALAWLVPHETAAISVEVLCTSYNHAPCHFMQSHILYATCYAVSIRQVCYSIYVSSWAVDRTLLPKNYGTMSNNNVHHKQLSSPYGARFRNIM